MLHPRCAAWIGLPDGQIAPQNRFTWFRKVFDVATPDPSAIALFAADSNARLWINGQLLRRKVARYHEAHITAERVLIGPHLRPGKNVVAVLHHNWGPITCFQRSANVRAGLWLQSDWVATDNSWRCLTAPEYAQHEAQIIGLTNDPRLRFVQVLDMNRALGETVHEPSFDDSRWHAAPIIIDGPWPPAPEVVETPGQREHAAFPLSVLAAGVANPPASVLADSLHNPLKIAEAMVQAQLLPSVDARCLAQQLLAGQSLLLRGQRGQTCYITFDFHSPTHGYPVLCWRDSSAHVSVDLGYGEIALSQYDGSAHVRPDGWVNTQGMVGHGYADRILISPGAGRAELPDERTARWLTLHIHFAADGFIELSSVGIIKSQYPVKPVGTFACDQPGIESIARLCLTHAKVTMIDAYVDTPGREDGQWLEDARPRARVAERWFGDGALRQLLIRTAAQSQGPDGNLHPFPPSNFPIASPYDWSMQWIGTLWDDYLWTGSTERIARYWPNLQKLLELLLSHVDERGLWITQNILRDLRVGLPLEPGQSSGMITPWLIERLRYGADMAQAIEQIPQARRWQQQAQRIAEAFKQFHLLPPTQDRPLLVVDRYDPARLDIDRGISQPAQVSAINAGLLTETEAMAALDYVLPDPDGSPPPGVWRWNNPTWSQRVLKALASHGRAERAVRHLLERYGPYLPAHPLNDTPACLQGSEGGPLPEYWISRRDGGLKPGQINSAQPIDDTGSHGWGCVPLLFLHEYLLGVTIAAPGGTKLRIAPQSGGLPFVAGHTATPKGNVWVYYDPQFPQLEITLPPGVEATIILPDILRAAPVRAGDAHLDGQTGRYHAAGGQTIRFDYYGSPRNPLMDAKLPG